MPLVALTVLCVLTVWIWAVCLAFDFLGEAARAFALLARKAAHLVWQHFSPRFTFFKYWFR
ncbi:MAG: hypothetical protein ACI84R_001966 [Candidatus Azotimanducaceae bacterium]|jgi:hypothetical protein